MKNILHILLQLQSQKVSENVLYQLLLFQLAFRIASMYEIMMKDTKAVSGTFKTS